MPLRKRWQLRVPRAVAKIRFSDKICWNCGENADRIILPPTAWTNIFTSIRKIYRTQNTGASGGRAACSGQWCAEARGHAISVPAIGFQQTPADGQTGLFSNSWVCAKPRFPHRFPFYWNMQRICGAQKTWSWFSDRSNTGLYIRNARVGVEGVQYELIEIWAIEQLMKIWKIAQDYALEDALRIKAENDSPKIINFALKNNDQGIITKNVCVLMAMFLQSSILWDLWL